MVLDGRRNIVIGHQGEAEVNATRNMKDTLKHLRRVSESCGYLTTRDGNTIIVFKDTGEHHLVYDSVGVLQSVGRIGKDGKFISQWARPEGAL